MLIKWWLISARLYSIYFDAFAQDRRLIKTLVRFMVIKCNTSLNYGNVMDYTYHPPLYHIPPKL